MGLTSRLARIVGLALPLHQTTNNKKPHPASTGSNVDPKPPALCLYFFFEFPSHQSLISCNVPSRRLPAPLPLLSPDARACRCPVSPCLGGCHWQTWLSGFRPCMALASRASRCSSSSRNGVLFVKNITRAGNEIKKKKNDRFCSTRASIAC